MRRPELSYANVCATLALFVSLGGTSFAVARITGRDVRDGSLTGRDLRDRSVHGRDLARNGLTGQQIAEATLGTVPAAASAQTATTATTSQQAARADVAQLAHHANAAALAASADVAKSADSAKEAALAKTADFAKGAGLAKDAETVDGKSASDFVAGDRLQGRFAELSAGQSRELGRTARYVLTATCRADDVEIAVTPLIDDARKLPSTNLQPLPAHQPLVLHTARDSGRVSHRVDSTFLVSSGDFTTVSGLLAGRDAMGADCVAGGLITAG